MKSKVVLLLALGSLGGKAFAGHENNGGNLTVVEFVSTARGIHDHLAASSGDARILSSSELARFEQVIDETRVEPVAEALTDRFGQRADATVEDDDINIGQKKIRIWEPAWREYLEGTIRKAVYQLVFHEYLRVMGYNEDQQPISSQLNMGGAAGGGSSLPMLSGEGFNLSFEKAGIDDNPMPQGWQSSYGNFGYTYSRDTQVKIVGGASGRIDGLQGTYFGAFAQCVSADRYRGKTVLLSGYVMPYHVTGYAGLWLRVDGPGGQVLSLDNMHDRGIGGTMSWQAVQTGAAVPANATYLCFGALMSGSGITWADGLDLRTL